MAKKTLSDFVQQRFDESRRSLSLAAIDFSIADDKILELREALRREAVEVQRLKRKKGFLSFLGL